MSNDPRTDLIYAILTMDSYNRGYGSGITGLNDTGSSAKIGNYSIRATTGAERSGWFDAGFYAIAYKKGSETIIAYRGTDNKGFSDSDTIGGSDPNNGYGIAFGLTGNGPVTYGTQQGKLAAAFYRAVTGNQDGATSGNVTVTGHSLGGGLAGYIGITVTVATFPFLNYDYNLAISSAPLHRKPAPSFLHSAKDNLAM